MFLRETWRELHGRCVGLVTNQTGVTSLLELTADAKKILGPLHAVATPETNTDLEWQ